MSTDKRDYFAAATALVLPSGLKDIEVALTLIKAGKISEGVTEIEDAVARLKALVPLFDAACDEGRK